MDRTTVLDKPSDSGLSSTQNSTLNLASLTLDNNGSSTESKTSQQAGSQPATFAAVNNFVGLGLGADGSYQGTRTSSASAPEAARPQNLLERGLDSVTSLVVSNDETRADINHYGANFLTTASMFAGGRVGWIGTGLMYGLSNVNPDSGAGAQTADFLLGVAKGESVKGLYAALGNSGTTYAPLKGMAMGLASRGVDDVFQRDLFSDPSKALGRLEAETQNTSALAYDAFVWTIGEGVSTGMNSATNNAFRKSPVLGSMLMGGTFGMLNGGGAEIARQQAAGANGFTDIQWDQVLRRGALQGGLDAAAAGLGSRLTLHSSLNTNLLSQALRRKAVLGVATAGMLLGTAGSVDAAQPQVPAPEQSGRPTLVQPVEAQSGASRPAAGTEATSNGAFHPRAVGFHPIETAKAPDSGVGVMAPLFMEQTPPPGQSEVTLQELHRRADNPNENSVEWKNFDRQLDEAKKAGIEFVATDVWMELFGSKYYDVLSDHIIAHGLKWAPILDLHSCGGNVGDTINIPVPDRVWQDVASKLPSHDIRQAQFVSEQGNASKEIVSVWATHLAIDQYADFMSQFQQRYASKAAHIAEINISLGPAGELRYPSYNQHDKGTGYPTDGALQCYSDLAKESFREYALEKIGKLEPGQKNDPAARLAAVRRIAQAWSIPNLTEAQILPPSNARQFFDDNNHLNTQYGRDLIDWYHQSLLDHGRQVLSAAVNVFGAKDAAFQGIAIGAKIPGVHWRIGTTNADGSINMGGRGAEVAAGLIPTSRNDWYNDIDGRGYRSILSMFAEPQFQPLHGGTRVVPSMTCVEMADGAGGAAVASLPHFLSVAVGQEAQRIAATHPGFGIRSENALPVHDPESWDRIDSVMKKPDGSGYYSGITLLRIGDVIDDTTALSRVTRLINSMKPPVAALVPPTAATAVTSPTAGPVARVG